MHQLSDRALVIRTRISVWTARQFDKQNTRELISNTEAMDDKAARVGVYLMAGADEKLKAVHARAHELRTYVDSVTVPWDANGGRVITPQQWVFQRENIENRIKSFERSVADFLGSYEYDVERAKIKLGALAKTAQYPTLRKVASVFKAGVFPEALPLAAPSDPRFGMNEDELADLRTNIEKGVYERFNDSIKQQFERLNEDIARLNKSVTEREERAAPIHESTIDKLRNTANVLRQMNITENTQIENLCDDVLDTLSNLSADKLRKSPTARETTKTATDAMLAKLKEWA